MKSPHFIIGNNQPIIGTGYIYYSINGGLTVLYALDTRIDIVRSYVGHQSELT